MAKRIIYLLEILVQDEFDNEFTGVDESGIESYIENCHPEIQFADLTETSA